MTSSVKYIGMDVHKESISIAVMNSVGKVVMECVIETKASVILQFIEGLRGDLHVTFEEGTAAAWLYDLLKPHVARLVVCNPRRNALLKVGNKNDRIDARKLAELLRGNQLQPVYHGEHGLRTLKELVRSYLTVSKDLARVMTRVKAVYHSWGIPCAGTQVYSRLYRVTWLSKLAEPGARLRAVSAGAKIPIVPVEFSPPPDVVHRSLLRMEEVPRLVKGERRARTKRTATARDEHPGDQQADRLGSQDDSKVYASGGGGTGVRAAYTATK